jgi:hypothetical protein
MTKTLNQIFFFLHQNQNIFLEKNHTPPPFKLNGRSRTSSITKITLKFIWPFSVHHFITSVWNCEILEYKVLRLQSNCFLLEYTIYKTFSGEIKTVYSLIIVIFLIFNGMIDSMTRLLATAKVWEMVVIAI